MDTQHKTPLSFKTRALNATELRFLRILKIRTTKEEGKKKTGAINYAGAGMISIAATYATIYAGNVFWQCLAGVVAVAGYNYLFLKPYEAYKTKKKIRSFIVEIDKTIEQGTINTRHINAINIAVAMEYRHEGDLFIIEYETDKVLYLWNIEDLPGKKLYCLDFEVYEERAIRILGRIINPLGKPVDPIIIDGKAKWAYMLDVGRPAHLYTENTPFLKIVDAINSKNKEN